MAPQDDLDVRFTYHKPTADDAKFYEVFRAEAKNLARVIVSETAPSREQSLALTNLHQQQQAH